MHTATELEHPEITADARATDRAWRRAQAISGLALTLFVSIHLLNTMLAAIPGAYDPFQRVVRLAYQSPAIEVLLVFLPLAVHLTAGVRSLAKRRTPTATAQLRTRLHRYAAWFLLLAIVGHVIATRGSSLFYGVYLGEIGLRFSLAWLPWFFIPYYALLGVAGVFHAAQGVPVALGILRTRVPAVVTRPSTFWPAVAIATFAVVLGVAGLAGWIYEQHGDPFQSEFAQLYRRLTGLD
jgi:succinate dehydrogenase/fumarate reductase cytochrome b subunit